MFIDSHMHINYGGFSLRSLIEYMDENRIDQCWVLTWVGAPLRYRSGIQEVYEAYEKYPSRIIPFYAPDPADPVAVAELPEWHRKGLGGIGELKVELNWSSPHITGILAQASQLRLPVVFHMEEPTVRYYPSGESAREKLLCRILNSSRLNGRHTRVVEGAAAWHPALRSRLLSRRRTWHGYLPDFAGLEKRLQEFPDVTFIGHGPLFWKAASLPAVPGLEVAGPEKDGGILAVMMERHGNLYADLSAESGYNALIRNKKFAEKFLSEFSDRLLYGTDNTTLGLKEFIQGCGLTRQAYRQICGVNAESIIARVAASADLRRVV